MAKRFSKCILHIGTEKTGTTTIQRFLSANRDAFAREGILYTACGGRNGSQRAFEACVHSKPWTTDLAVDANILDARAQVAFRTKFLAELHLEIDTHPQCETLIVSCEHFHSRLTTLDEIGKLKELLSPWVETFFIILYLRRQDRVAVSLYSTRLKAGQVAPVLFPRAHNGAPSYYFDYDSVYANWAQVFGERAIHVRLFEPAHFINNDLLSDFSSTADLPLTGKQLPERANESLSDAGIHFLLELNRQYPSVVHGKRDPKRTALHALVANLCRGNSPIAARTDAVAFYDLYRAGNDRLRARLFPGQPGPLFDEDFSDYPEHVDQTTGKYGDAVQIAIHIWKTITGLDYGQRHSQQLAAADKELKVTKAENAFLRGQLALKNGNAKNAKRLFEKALAINPAHSGAHLGLARILLNSPDQADGLAHLDHALRISTKMTPEIERLYAQFRAQRCGSA